MITMTPKRLTAFAFAAALAFGACSSSGSSSAPASAAPELAAPASAPAESAPASAAASASAAAMAPPAPSADNVTLQGSGATFPAPLYDSWFQTYTEANPQVQFDYQAIGSGGGIKAITDGTVDFGASDAAMKDEEIAALPADCKVLHIPTALGAVAVIYNLPGVASVNLDADNVAGIYLGTIKKWNDPAIAANNPGSRCRTPTSSSPTARTGRAPQTPSPPTSTRCRRTGTPRSARARKSIGRRASAPRAMTASLALSSRRQAPSAMSSSITRPRPA